MYACMYKDTVICINMHIKMYNKKSIVCTYVYIYWKNKILVSVAEFLVLVIVLTQNNRTKKKKKKEIKKNKIK